MQASMGTQACMAGRCHRDMLDHHNLYDDVCLVACLQQVHVVWGREEWVGQRIVNVVHFQGAKGKGGGVRGGQGGWFPVPLPRRP